MLSFPIIETNSDLRSSLSCAILKRPCSPLSCHARSYHGRLLSRSVIPDGYVYAAVGARCSFSAPASADCVCHSNIDIVVCLFCRTKHPLLLMFVLLLLNSLSLLSSFLVDIVEPGACLLYIFLLLPKFLVLFFSTDTIRDILRRGRPFSQCTCMSLI